MNPTIAVDIGNSRMKWGRCDDQTVVDAVVLAHDDPTRWKKQFASWQVGVNTQWAISDVAPKRSVAFIEWLEGKGFVPLHIKTPAMLPLTTKVDNVHRVGMDRLFNAVAANDRRPTDKPAVMIDAGSAVTVDVVSDVGVFEGGAILPGFRLAAAALHDYTALLPVVSITDPSPPFPGKSTEAAMRAGIYWMIVGAVRVFVEQTTHKSSPTVFLTGGDAHLLQPALSFPAIYWPHMTLEGIRLTARAIDGESAG